METSQLITNLANATGILPIASGGTSSSSATGTGQTVLATSPTLITPNLGNALSTSVRTSGFTVAGLPAGTAGQRVYVTDALTPAYNGALVGGGTVVVPVFYNGTAWVSA